MTRILALAAGMAALARAAQGGVCLGRPPFASSPRNNHHVTHVPLHPAPLLSSSSTAAAGWAQLVGDNNESFVAPARRSGPIAMALPSSSSPSAPIVVVHGGCSSSCCYAPLADLWAWTPAGSGSGTWSNVSVPTGSAVPDGRLYHAASPASSSASSSASFFVFGGDNEADGFLNDLWLLSLTSSGSSGGVSGTWKLLDANAPPTARAGHSLVPVPSSTDGSFLLLGGTNGTDVLDDVWMYDATTSAWTEVGSMGGSGPGPRTQFAAAGWSSTSGPAKGNWVVLTGGSDALGNDHADVWAFDVDTHSWAQLAGDAAPSGAAWPPVRHGHSVWADAGESGAPPRLLLFGGQHGAEDTDPYLGDLWSFVPSGTAGNFTLIEPGTTNPNPQQPVARGIGASVAGSLAGGQGGTESALYFGGFSGYDGGLADLLHNDVWQLQGI
jgi:hypothetical protein